MVSKMLISLNPEKALPLLNEQQHDSTNLALVHADSKWANDNPFDDSTSKPYNLDMIHRDNQSSPPYPHSHSSGPNNCAQVSLLLVHPDSNSGNIVYEVNHTRKITCSVPRTIPGNTAKNVSFVG